MQQTNSEKVQKVDMSGLSSGKCANDYDSSIQTNCVRTNQNLYWVFPNTDSDWAIKKNQNLDWAIKR